MAEDDGPKRKRSERYRILNGFHKDGERKQGVLVSSSAPLLTARVTTDNMDTLYHLEWGGEPPICRR